MMNYSILPEHMQDGMKRYIENGIQPGHFLTAVLENDFMEAFKRADDINMERMRDYAMFLYNEAPRGCHGSPALVEEWCAHHGLEWRAA